MHEWKDWLNYNIVHFAVDFFMHVEKRQILYVHTNKCVPMQGTSLWACNGVRYAEFLTVSQLYISDNWTRLCI